MIRGLIVPVFFDSCSHTKTVGNKKGPPLAQGARRGVVTPSGLQQGAGERIPVAGTKLGI
jgi:hypothetical protein